MSETETKWLGSWAVGILIKDSVGNGGMLNLVNFGFENTHNE